MSGWFGPILEQPGERLQYDPFLQGSWDEEVLSATVIKTTRLDGSTVHVSPHQIEVIEQTPDTVLCLISGKRIIVQESVEEITDRIVEYRSRLGGAPDVVSGEGAPGSSADST